MSLKRRTKFRSVTKKCGLAAKFFLLNVRTYTRDLRTPDKIKGFSMKPRRDQGLRVHTKMPKPYLARTQGNERGGK